MANKVIIASGAILLLRILSATSFDFSIIEVYAATWWNNCEFYKGV